METRMEGTCGMYGAVKLVQSTLLLVEATEKGGRGEREVEEEEGKKRRRRKRGGGEEEEERRQRRGRVGNKRCAQFTYGLNVSCMELGSRGKKCQTRMCVNNVLVE